MNGKEKLNETLFLIILLATMFALSGCDSGTNNPPDDGLTDTIPTIRTELVENGAQPVWLNDTYSYFLFSYKDDIGVEGIYMSGFYGTVTTLWTGANNHDYLPSPDANRVAFSSPDVGSGVVIVNVNTEEDSLILEGGKHPAWLTDDILIAETAEGGIVAIDLTTSEITEVIGAGYSPICAPDGSGFAFIRSNASSYGQTLYWKPYNDGEWGSTVTVATGVGNDAVFSPTGLSVYISVVDSEEQSVIVRYTLTAYATGTAILNGAWQPSISGDGDHLFADRISSSTPGNLHYTNLDTGEYGIVMDATFPAAMANGSTLLVESDWGIEYLELEL